MLVLSRKPGERIQIDKDVTVVVLGISGNRVRLGFEAPPHVSIQRSEIAPQNAESVPEVGPLYLCQSIPFLISADVHENETVA